ncbi:MAG: FAD-binding oxidoreductase [Sphaerotilus natans subsp. sulfidivorans]|uniref:FAD-binding oxidoreductase n=1 Tax=Sphaerotilus sulfidivorans TaxID=639200 RepID=UPI00235721E8|nr:FAD-binding oxidoreductase [Sphaerotilus sulfidivorans]MCK6401355.1 FAD-binding oxidoreductase [Sphaerotilus sulfidivorans]
MSTTSVLPKGVSKARFAEAVKAYRAIVGDAWVMVDLDRLRPYSRLMIPDQAENHAPSGAICPASVEEIQKVLAVSRQYRIPLWTISVGRNYGYGEAAPATPGQMVLDLKRMNRILEVDAELGTALVEPGVTFQQLADYIEEHKLPFWLNKPAPAPLVGPVGWTLERGMGYTRYQEAAQHFSGMEVVLADGSVVRTGMGGVANAKSWTAYRFGYGPQIDGLFMQSNLGIVTKMGIWLMKKPAATKTWVAGFRNFDDATLAVEVLRDLRLDGLIDNGFVMHMSYGVALTHKRADIYKGPGAVPDAMWAGIAKQMGAPLWSAAGTLYGTPEQIAVNQALVRAAMEKIGGLFMPEEAIQGPGTLMLNNIRMLTTNQLSLEDFAIFNYRGGGCAWVAPIIPAKAADAKRCMEIIQRVKAKHGFDFFGGFMAGFSGRHFDAASILLFDRDNPDELQRAKACYLELVDETAKAGYPVYRANTQAMDLTAKYFGTAQRQFNARLKQALDPLHILAPGKSGIA